MRGYYPAGWTDRPSVARAAGVTGKPIRIVVPFAAGSFTGLLSKLGSELGCDRACRDIGASFALPVGRRRMPRDTPRSEELSEFLRRHRLAEIIALHLVTVVRPQEAELRIGFHAFGDDVELQSMAK